MNSVIRSATSCLLLLAAAGCGTGSSGRTVAPGPFEPWAEPINDALEVGEAAFDGEFSRGITTLQPFEGRVWIGYGDANRNIGSEIPVDFRWFEAPDDPIARTADVLAAGQGARQRTPSDTGEEQLEPYRVIGGTLWQPGVDSNNPDEAWTQTKAGTWRTVDGERVQTKLIDGNVFKLEASEDGTPVWRKFRNVPGGEHVHDLAEFDGAIYAVGSGADYRFEFGNGKVFRYLWRSDDGGRTFETVVRIEVPDVGYDTRFRRLLATGDRLYVLGYLNPFQIEGEIEGRSIVVTHEDGVIVREALEGPLSTMLPLRTFYVPGRDWGLVVAREGRRGAEHVFRADEDGVVELEGWQGHRVIDLQFLDDGSTFLVLAGSGRPATEEEVETFQLLVGSVADPDALSPVAPIEGVVPRSLAVFGDSILLGTDDGRVFKASLGAPGP